jgi:hypothetical protein
MQVPVNLAYSVRVLAHDLSDEADEILSKVYSTTTSPVIRRDVILVMARRNADYWISDVRRRFGTMTEWERRAMGIASFILADEGDHWRRAVTRQMSPLCRAVVQWADERRRQPQWSIPV